jgi:Dolichyl-phosphate-mannose-protein mannosyltransferase
LDAALSPQRSRSRESQATCGDRAVSAASRAAALPAVAAALFAVGASLRFWGIYWGMPVRIDLHPDEVEHVMAHALAVSWSDPDPHFLNYPSLLIYLIALGNGALTRLGLIHAPWQSYLLARSIVALFGAATAPAAFWLGIELGGSLLAAALAGLWVTVLPLHVWESHFAVTDVVMTFWIIVALAASVRLLRHGEVGDHLLVGAAIGLAIASKYTAALVGISPCIATALARRPMAVSLRNLVALGLAALVFCFFATPFTFLHFSQFREAMAYEYEHVHSLHYGFSLPAAGWQYHKYLYELVAGFPFSLGLALYGSAVAGAVWALSSPRRGTAVVLGFVVPFFAILGHWTFTPLRYMLPVLVVGAVFAGLWQVSWIESQQRTRQAIGATVAVLAFAYTAAFTVSTTARLRHDTRIEAAHWLDATLAPGTRLLICGFSPYMAIPTDPRIRVIPVNEVWISRLAGRTDFDVVEISSMHFWRYERHHQPAFDPAYRSFRHGERGFHLVKAFAADFLNRDFYRRLDPMFAGYFVSPTIEFYSRDATPAPPA